MKHNKIMIIAISLTMVLMFTLTAIAGPRGGRRHHKGGMGHGLMLMKMIDNLNLSAEQQKQVANVLVKYKDKMKNNLKNLMTAKEAMAQAVHADIFNDTAIRQTFQEVSDKQVEVIVLRAQIMSELKSIFTSEQTACLKAHRAKRVENMEEKFEQKWSRFETWLENLGQ